MGTWGPKIFQSDEACDIREDYKAQIILGKSEAEAEQEIIAEYNQGLGEEFWLPLAYTEWKLGRLSELAKQNALAEIDRQLTTLGEYWKKEMIPKREKELLALRETLHSDMPAPKKLRMPWWAWKCPWSIGSVLQFRIAQPIKDNPLLGKYILLLLVGITKTPKGKLPCEWVSVRLYHWIGDVEPMLCLPEIMAQKPALTPFILRNGATKESLTLMMGRSVVRASNVKCVSETPLFSESFQEVSPYVPEDCFLPDLLMYTLGRHGDG